MNFDVKFNSDLSEVIVNGIPATRFHEAESSRPIFTINDEQNNPAFLIKFDEEGKRKSERPIFHQSSVELERFNSMDDEDKEFFVAPVTGKLIQIGEYGRGYIIQPYVKDLNHPIPSEMTHELIRVLRKYRITDISLLYNENCGFSPSLNKPVIYDYGMAYPNGKSTRGYNYFCGSECNWCEECSELDMEY